MDILQQLEEAQKVRHKDSVGRVLRQRQEVKEKALKKAIELHFGIKDTPPWSKNGVYDIKAGSVVKRVTAVVALLNFRALVELSCDGTRYRYSFAMEEL